MPERPSFIAKSGDPVAERPNPLLQQKRKDAVVDGLISNRAMLYKAYLATDGHERITLSHALDDLASAIEKLKAAGARPTRPGSGSFQ